MKKLLTLLFLCQTWLANSVEVASLHPLITDLIKKVGGGRVTVIEIGRPGMNVHDFSPRAGDLRRMARARLIFASGKGLETYLGDLEDSLQSHQQIIEVGRSVPSQKITADDAVYACCPTHQQGSIDPHWWHNVRNMEPATRLIAKKLSALDPEGKAYYQAQSRAAIAHFRQLDRWVKGQIATIPKSRRHLVTAHAAFGYFCKAYRMKATYVQGLSARGEVSSKQLAESVQQIRAEGIPVFFPEKAANPKVLRQIAKASGARLGKPLIADGAVASYDQFMQTNVTRIVEGLK